MWVHGHTASCVRAPPGTDKLNVNRRCSRAAPMWKCFHDLLGWGVNGKTTNAVPIPLKRLVSCVCRCMRLPLRWATTVAAHRSSGRFLCDKTRTACPLLHLCCHRCAPLHRPTHLSIAHSDDNIVRTCCSNDFTTIDLASAPTAPAVTRTATTTTNLGGACWIRRTALVLRAHAQLLVCDHALTCSSTVTPCSTAATRS